MTDLIVGACVGFIVGIWFHHLTMRAIFKKLKSEIGSRQAGIWDEAMTEERSKIMDNLIEQDADLIDLDDAKRIIALRDWLYSDGQYWSERKKEIDALFTENERLRVALKRSREGWENAIELGLIPERHRNTAQILIEVARAALGEKQ